MNNAKQLFVVIRSHGPGWQESRPLEAQQSWEAHASFMDGLAAEGFVVLAGPLQDAPEALLVVRASNPQKVEDRLALDPWTTLNLLRTTRIAPWILRLGSL